MASTLFSIKNIINFSSKTLWTQTFAVLVRWYHRQSGWTKRPQPSMKLDVRFLPNFRHGKQNRKGNLISSVIPFIISPYLHHCLTQMGRFPAWLRITCYRRWTSVLRTCGAVFLSASHWPWAYDVDLDVDLQGKSSRWTGVGKVCHRMPDTQQIVFLLLAPNVFCFLYTRHTENCVFLVHQTHSKLCLPTAGTKCLLLPVHRTHSKLCLPTTGTKYLLLPVHWTHSKLCLPTARTKCFLLPAEWD